MDSGKSTLCGRLRHALGLISKKQMHKYEKEAKEKVSSVIQTASTSQPVLLCICSCLCFCDACSDRGKGHLHMLGLWMRAVTRGSVALQ